MTVLLTSGICSSHCSIVMGSSEVEAMMYSSSPRPQPVVCVVRLETRTPSL